MNDHVNPSDDTTSSGNQDLAATDSGAAANRSVVLLVAAAVIVVATVAAVVTFGVVRPPQLPSVSGAQGVPSVAWTQWEGDRQCLMVASSAGEVSSLVCDREYAELVAWTDEGIIAHRWQATGTEIVIDPVTGQILERRAIPDEFATDFVGNAITSYHEDGRRVVEDAETRQVLWDVEIASVYDVYGGTASPDGRWIAAGDSARRLLLFDRSGGQGPWVWATDVDAGWSVVFEGSEVQGNQSPTGEY